MTGRLYSNQQTQLRKSIYRIIGIIFLFSVISCGSSGDTTSPSGNRGDLDSIKALTLDRVTEDSISLGWELLKTKEGIADSDVIYTVYVETNDGGDGEVFEKDPDTETVYSLSSLPVDGTKVSGVKVTNLTNHTPYRIVVEAIVSGSTSRTELLAYTASVLADFDIAGVEAANIIDSEEVTVTWNSKAGAQAYLLQVSEYENRVRDNVLLDNVLAENIFAVVCPPGSLLCEREDQFAQEKDGELLYPFQVNKKAGRYKLVIVPFNFQDLRGLQPVDAEGRARTFTEGVLSLVEDETSILAQRLQSALNDAQEIQLKVSKAGAPTDLVLDSTGHTLSASWGHGIGAESYHAILTDDEFTVTNTIDRYESSGRFTGGGYTEFSNLTANTSYTVTVQSLTVVNHITNVITNVGGVVSATLSTKDAPEAVVNLAVTAAGNQATVTWERSPVGNPATKYVLEYLTDVTTLIIHIDGDDADAELSGLSWEGALSVEVMTNDSGKYSSLVSDLDIFSTTVFRVKGVRDVAGEEWGSAYRYYALVTDFSKAPSPVKNLTLSGHTADGSFRVAWEKPDDPGQDRSKAAAQLAGYKVAWGTTAEVDGGSTEIDDPDILSRTITGLTPGTQYYVKVQAKNNNEVGNIYNAGSAGSTYTVKPPAEVTLTYSGHTTNGFKVSWDAVMDAGYAPEGKLTSVGYLIELSDQGDWRPIPRSDYLATEETFSDLTPGIGYRVRVTVTNSFPLSNVKEGGETWTLSLPGPVGGLMVSDPNYDGENDGENHNGGFKVSWAAPSDTGLASDGNDATVTGYEIAYAEVVEGTPGGYTSINHGETTTEYLFTDLKTNAKYAIRVHARTAAGVGVGSPVSGWTPSLPGAVAPDSIVFSRPTAHTIRIGWTASAPGRAGGSSASNALTLYQVKIAPERGEMAPGENTYVLVRDNYSGNDITVTNLSRSTIYRAQVTAKNVWGSAPVSVSASTGTTAEKDSTPPSAVENLEVVSVTSSQVKLSWARPTNTGTTDGTTTASLSNYAVKYRKTINDNSGFVEITTNSEGVQLTGVLMNTSTTATVTGLSGNTRYTFLVVAINSANEATSDAEAATAEGTTLSAISPSALPALSIFNDGTDVYLSWTVEHFGSNAEGRPAEFSSYLVENKKKDDPQWATITNFNVNTMSYLHRVRESGIHTYRVTVTNTAIPPQGSTSEEVSVTIAAATAPGTPTAFTVSNEATTTSSISLTWESPDAGTEIGGLLATISGYHLQYKKSSENNWRNITLNATSLRVSELTPSITYNFRLYASNSGQLQSSTPAEIDATTLSAIAPPALPALSISNYGTNIYLNWTVEHFGSNAEGRPAEFSSSLVEKKKKDDPQWDTITNFNVNTMSYLHRVRESGIHTYRVTVTNTAIPPQGSTSAEKSIDLDAATAPDSPTAFTGSNIAATSMVLTWEKPVNTGTEIGGLPATISYYLLQYSEGEGVDWTSIRINGATSLTVTNLNPDTSYEFNLKAYNSGGLRSERPAEFSATTASGAAPLAQPALSVSNYETNVYLNWTVEHFGSNADGSPVGFSSYRVEQKTEGSQWNLITTIVDVNTMSYSHQVESSITYTYRVTVTNTRSEEKTSAEVSITPLPLSSKVDIDL